MVHNGHILVDEEVHSGHIFVDEEIHNGHVLVEEEVQSVHILETLHIVLCHNEKMECPQRHGILQVCGGPSHDDKEVGGHEEVQELLSICRGHGDRRQESLHHSVLGAGEIEEQLLVQQVGVQRHHTHRHNPQCHSHHSPHQ